MLPRRSASMTAMGTAYDVEISQLLDSYQHQQQWQWSQQPGGSQQDYHKRQDLSPEIWSQLPIELLREILLFAAINDLQDARALRLVSRHVNVWLLPFMFQTLTLTSVTDVHGFANLLAPTRKRNSMVGDAALGLGQGGSSMRSSFQPPFWGGYPSATYSAHSSRTFLASALSSSPARTSFDTPFGDTSSFSSPLPTIPRSLSSYIISSLALVVKTHVPSVEASMARVAPALTHLQNLVITGQNLSSHAHWLRQYPIFPRKVLIVHFGRPQSVDFQQPVFQCVTHLYTPVLELNKSSVRDLPELTHLAVKTRISLGIINASAISRSLRNILRSLPGLKMVVLCLDMAGGGGKEETEETVRVVWNTILEPCFADPRFYVLTKYFEPMQEWHRIVEGSSQPESSSYMGSPFYGDGRFGSGDLWDRALRFGSNKYSSNGIGFESGDAGWRRMFDIRSMNEESGESEWEIDLVQREGFTEIDEDPTELCKCCSSFCVVSI
ncbi:hypothetical protein BDN72DRAFT_300644 [Pluteus cervinus]|uniref:Uncharacterized protein n=1 Tax=Pluteus cervinus TaxID=181527 RepID=A0ACD3AEQ9_9AGAR|nr:hypothetical protein BDN72DRAFT_300644 [Pluteus cervinus]